VLPGNVRHVLWQSADLRLELVVHGHDGDRHGGIESSQFLHGVLEGGAGITNLVNYEHAFAANQGAEGAEGLVEQLITQHLRIRSVSGIVVQLQRHGQYEPLDLRESKHTISDSLACSPHTSHQRSLMSFDYHHKIQGDLMADSGEAVFSLQKAAQVRLDNLGLVKNHSCFVNNPNHIELLEQWLELQHSSWRKSERVVLLRKISVV